MFQLWCNLTVYAVVNSVLQLDLRLIFGNFLFFLKQCIVFFKNFSKFSKFIVYLIDLSQIFEPVNITAPYRMTSKRQISRFEA